MDEQEYDVSGLDALYAALEARGIRVTEEEADMPMLDETQIGEDVYKRQQQEYTQVGIRIFRFFRMEGSNRFPGRRSKQK